MAGYPTCARCDSPLPASAFPLICPRCGATITGNVCKMCGQFGGWDYVDGFCARCHAQKLAAGFTNTAPKRIKREHCRSCGSELEGSPTVCPFCGLIRWDDILAWALWAALGFGAVAASFLQQDALIRNLLLWGGVIWSALFLIAIAAGLAEVWSHHHQGRREVTWQPKPAPVPPPQPTQPTTEPYRSQELLAHLPKEALQHLRLALIPRTADRPLVDRSGFGGVPYLPEGFDHPQCLGCGQPMAQFLQLRLADLPEEERPAGQGLLQFFYCANEMPDGSACEYKFEAYRPYSPATVVRLVPDLPGYPSAIPARYPPKRVVGWTRQLEPPDWSDMDRIGLDIDEDLLDGLSEAGLPSSRDKLGGWPAWVQGNSDPVTCPKCQTRMRFIFQVASEDHVDHMFGDGGTGWLWQCPDHPEEMAFGCECS